LGGFNETNESTGYWQVICSIDYKTTLLEKDFGGDFEKHQHSSFRNQVRYQLGTAIEDCAKHQKIHLKSD